MNFDLSASLPPDDQTNTTEMTLNTNKVPQPSAGTDNDKAKPSITPYTTLEGLQKFSDKELSNALRDYRKPSAKSRNYRHICRLIKAEQKRRVFPAFANLQALKKEAGQ